jgi:hypothetical protein
MKTRGFQGRRSRSEPKRLPEGQYLTSEFPVLSAGPTPHTPSAPTHFLARGGFVYRLLPGFFFVGFGLREVTYA